MRTSWARPISMCKVPPCTPGVKPVPSKLVTSGECGTRFATGGSLPAATSAASIPVSINGIAAWPHGAWKPSAAQASSRTGARRRRSAVMP